MRGWLTEAAAAARLVSDRPQLWVAGGLAWAATAGPVALVVAVVPAPNVSDLTFLGARAFVAASWPWNAVAVAGFAIIAVLLMLALVSLADAFLMRGGESVGPSAGVARAFAATVLAAVPVLVMAAATGLVAARVAPGEFSAPDTSDGGPVVRTLLVLGPLLGLLLVAAVTAGACATAARVLALRRRAALGDALAGAVPLLAAATPASAIQALVAAAARLAYLVLAILLLGVLWAPIREELAGGAGFGAAQGALLVGFVAIWLCLVLGGGALHAWGSVSWTRILAVRSPSLERGDARSKETPSTP